MRHFCKTNKSNLSSSKNLKYYTSNIKGKAFRVKVWWQANLYLGCNILKVSNGNLF